MYGIQKNISELLYDAPTVDGKPYAKKDHTKTKLYQIAVALVDKAVSGDVEAIRLIVDILDRND